jgi:hypothetical protein
MSYSRFFNRKRVTRDTDGNAIRVEEDPYQSPKRPPQGTQYPPSVLVEDPPFVEDPFDPYGSPERPPQGTQYPPSVLVEDPPFVENPFDPYQSPKRPPQGTPYSPYEGNVRAEDPWYHEVDAQGTEEPKAPFPEVQARSVASITPMTLHPYGEGIPAGLPLQGEGTPKDESLDSLQALFKEQQHTIAQQRKEFNRAQIQWATDISFHIERYQNLQQCMELEMAQAQGKIDSLTRTMNSLVKEKADAIEQSKILDGQIQGLRNALTEMQQKALETERKLTTQMVSEVEPPINHENYYMARFENLMGGIEMWITNCLEYRSEPWPSFSQKKVLDILLQLGSSARFSAEKLGPKLGDYYQSLRIPLLRHIISLFLFHRILDPFAYTMNIEVSNYWKNIEDKMLGNFSKIIRNPTDEKERDYNHGSRRCVGRAIAGSITTAAIRSQRETDIADLLDLMNLLFVKSKPRELESWVGSTVGRAIDLKMALTADSPVYRCYFIDCGDAADSDWIEIGPTKVHRILMCLCPGLLRRNLVKQGSVEALAVVKARGHCG